MRVKLEESLYYEQQYKAIQPSINKSGDSLLQQQAELDQLRGENEKLEEMLKTQNEQFKQQSVKLLQEKEQSEENFKNMYKQLETSGKDSEGKLNARIEQLTQETLKLTQTLNQCREAQVI